MPYIGRGFAWDADPAVIVVTNNVTETRWWQAPGREASAVCLIRGRLLWKSTLQGQTTLYFGTDVAAFRAAFAPFGVTLRMATPHQDQDGTDVQAA